MLLKHNRNSFLTSIQNTDAVCLSSFSDFCSSFIPSLPAPPKFKLPIDFRIVQPFNHQRRDSAPTTVNTKPKYHCISYRLCETCSHVAALLWT